MSYRPGRYTKIEVHDPKHRMVSAAPFRDRVVHHALCAVCEPIFERGFIADSYANRAGKGTHRAVDRYEGYHGRFRYVLRGDVYRYFPAIDHACLKDDLRRRISCRRTLWLCDTIIDGSNPQEPVNLDPAVKPDGSPAPAGFFGAVPGTTNRGTCGPRTGTGTGPGTGTTISGFG